MKELPTVAEVMDTDFMKFSADTTVQEAVNTLERESLFGACIVEKGDKLIGIFSEKQCLRLFRDKMLGNLSKPIEEVTVKEIMYPEFDTISSDKCIVDVAQVFLTSEFRRMPVVDAGRLVGQITRRDIVKAIQDFAVSK